MSIEYAIIVRNKTRLEVLIERFNTRAQAKFYIESQGGDFDDYQQEHERFHEALSAIQRQLSTVMKHKLVDRSFVPSFLFSPAHLIIVVGQDGLVANTAKYAGMAPVVAVNPDRTRYDGVLLPYDTGNFLGGVSQVLSGSAVYKTVRFAEARLNDGQRLLAFNDLFVGASSHVSARYRLSWNGLSEEQSSSGLIISTHAGSTGWLSSVFNMAYGVAAMFEPDLKPKRPRIKADELVFAVREPFKSVRTQTTLNIGRMQANDVLKIESLMPAHGVIFSDGMESDFLKFNSGSVVTIGIAPETARLVMKNK